MVMGVVFDFGWNAVPALSLYFFVASGFWGRVAVRLRAGVKEFSFQVDFSCGVRVLIVRSSGGVVCVFDLMVQSVERVSDWVVFAVEN